MASKGKVNEEKIPTVYLDHLIKRESLRYYRKPEGGIMETQHHDNSFLNLAKLNKLNNGNTKYLAQLRKPDFQRATLSWTPEDCVKLLESMLDRLVIPGIVMWTSTSSLNYILDGAHRVSVAMAWLANDWGESVADKVSRSEKRAKRYKDAAKETRKLVAERVGYIDQFEADYNEMMRIQAQDDGDTSQMGEMRLKRANFYSAFLNDQIGFHVQYVTGDYNKAEQSFLRINSGGKRLTDWETRVIAYRNSSAMRLIMSIANADSAEHYWPKNAEIQLQKIEQVREGVARLRSALFSPQVEATPFILESKPLLGTPGQADKPTYLGQMLCVLRGEKGTPAEVNALLEHDATVDDSARIIANGLDLVANTSDKLAHLLEREGMPNSKGQNKAMNVMPLLYFYQPRGDFISGALYGFVYWMLHGSRDDVLMRKRIFSSYRRSFEEVLLNRKDDLIRNMSRGTGSGPKVTTTAARYYQGVLESLIKHRGDPSSPGFTNDYTNLIQELFEVSPRVPLSEQEASSAGRNFTPTARQISAYLAYFSRCTTCGICGGFRDPSDTVQYDHKVDHAKGGPSNIANLQIAHPFCNNPETKSMIAQARQGVFIPALPILNIG